MASKESLKHLEEEHVDDTCKEQPFCEVEASQPETAQTSFSDKEEVTTKTWAAIIVS